jgi:hypothetical protein
VLGLAWGLLSGGLGWLLGINRLELSEGLRRTLYLAVVVVVGSSGGLVTAVLVRPRNAAADLTAGAIVIFHPELSHFFHGHRPCCRLRLEMG